MQPLVIARAPLRVSLAGGGSDLPEYWQQPGRIGRALSFGIDKYVWVTLSRRFEPEILVSYRDMEIAEGITNIKHDLVRKAFLRFGMPNEHIEVHMIANLPGRGTGLGSSSALAVALVRACRAWYGLADTGFIATAQEAWELERQEGPAVGIQDHTAAAFEGNALFEFTGSKVHSPIVFTRATENIEGLFERLMLFFVGDRTGSGKAIMADMAHSFIDEAYSRTLDIVSQQAADMTCLLIRKDWAGMGKILRKGWQAKKQFCEGISDPRIDEIYDTALNLGAYGGKICGAGGGGFMLIFTAPEKRANISFALNQLGCKELFFGPCAGRPHEFA